MNPSRNIVGYHKCVIVGGKVVARHEEKAHRFLFPSDQEDKLREVVMTKGRRYEVSLFSYWACKHVHSCWTLLYNLISQLPYH